MKKELIIGIILIGICLNTQALTKGDILTQSQFDSKDWTKETFASKITNIYLDQNNGKQDITFTVAYVLPMRFNKQYIAIETIKNYRYSLKSYTRCTDVNSTQYCTNRVLNYLTITHWNFLNNLKSALIRLQPKSTPKTGIISDFNITTKIE